MNSMISLAHLFFRGDTEERRARRNKKTPPLRISAKKSEVVR